MNNEKIQPILNRDNLSIPEELFEDNHSREMFLTHLGSIKPMFVPLFKRLCDVLRPKVNYAMICSKLEKEFPDFKYQLKELMLLIEKAHCGLMVKQASNVGSDIDRIVLTRPDSLIYWYWYIENMTINAHFSDDNPLPKLEHFNEFAQFPWNEVKKLSLDDVSNDFIRANYYNVVLYSIKVSERTQFLTTPASLYLLINSVRKRLRSNILGKPIGNQLAKLMNMDVHQFHMSFQVIKIGKFERNLCGILIANQQKSSLFNKKIMSDIFDMAILLKAYIDNHLRELEQVKLDRKEQNDALDQIYNNLINHPETMITAYFIDSQFTPYEKERPALKEMFFKRFMEVQENEILPNFVKLWEYYIYRNDLYPFIETSLQIAAKELKNYYINEFELILKRSSTNQVNIFAGLGSFRNALQARFKKEYPLLDVLYKNPRLLSDMIVYYKSHVIKGNNESDLMAAMGKYFIKDTGQIKPLDRILEIDILHLLEEAFMRLNWIKRCFMRLSGLYDSYIQQYSHSPMEKVGLKGAEENVRDRRKKSKGSATVVQEKKQRLPDKDRSVGYSKRPPRKHAVDADEVWEEFKNVAQEKKDQ